MRYVRGTSADLTTTVTNDSGAPITASEVTVDILGPDGIKVDDGVAELVSSGLYRYTYAIPADALVGLYRIEWTVVVGPNTFYGDEPFEVGEAFEVEPIDVQMSNRLRENLGEVKEIPDGDGSETFFTDVQIADLLEYAADDLSLATWEGWKRKMARYARLVDVSESGSDRKMSQKFKQAQVMEKVWAGIVGEVVAGRSAALRRVVGKSVNLGAEIDPMSLLTPFSGYADHIREYPTHRLLIPAVLG